MQLRPATPEDFAFIRALAQRPDYAPFITDEDEAALGAYVASPDADLLIAVGPDAKPLGYALFAGLTHPGGVIELRRLALAHAGSGLGRSYITLLINKGFSYSGAKRLWLDASGENPRALTLYRAAGFTIEGHLRNHWYRPALKRVVDMYLFGMMREEWDAQPQETRQTALGRP